MIFDGFPSIFDPHSEVENIGPLTMSPSSGELAENPHAWSNDYNVIIIDNPVGSGFSGWVKEETALIRRL